MLTKNGYQPPHPTTLSRQLNDLTSNLQQCFISELRGDLKSWPFITFDNWKGDNETNYLIITLHYISDD